MLPRKAKIMPSSDHLDLCRLYCSFVTSVFSCDHVVGDHHLVLGRIHWMMKIRKFRFKEGDNGSIFFPLHHAPSHLNLFYSILMCNFSHYDALYRQVDGVFTRPQTLIARQAE